ncbi:hypothetical protein [Candidatus Leptofilum sp.]|uniref:hypothetical protein n=1 Tax=Candidatus Leptofilum sp. TaxID=3241576 RepID=UPI003B5C700B
MTITQAIKKVGQINSNDTVSCTEFLGSLAQWLKNKPEGDDFDHTIQLALSASVMGGVVRYAEGQLKIVRQYLMGTATLYENQERFGFPGKTDNDPLEGTVSATPYPFNPHERDSLTVRIDTKSGHITLEVENWKSTLSNPDCTHGLLYGFSDKINSGSGAELARDYLIVSLLPVAILKPVTSN